MEEFNKFIASEANHININDESFTKTKDSLFMKSKNTRVEFLGVPDEPDYINAKFTSNNQIKDEAEIHYSIVEEEFKLFLGQ